MAIQKYLTIQSLNFINRSFIGGKINTGVSYEVLSLW